MFPRQTQSFLLHVEGSGTLYDVLSIGYITYHSLLLQDAEGAHLGLDTIALQFFLDDGIVCPIDKGIVLSLVLHNTHLGIGIVLHAVVIAVQMVGSDVEQYCDVGPELVHIVELEAAQLNDVVIEVPAFRYLQGEAAPYVASQTHVVPGLLEYMIYKACGSGLAV